MGGHVLPMGHQDTCVFALIDLLEQSVRCHSLRQVIYLEKDDIIISLMKISYFLNVYMNHSELYWHNHVFDLLFWPRLGGDLITNISKVILRATRAHWHWTALVVIIWVIMYLPDSGLNPDCWQARQAFYILRGAVLR